MGWHGPEPRKGFAVSFGALRQFPGVTQTTVVSQGSGMFCARSCSRPVWEAARPASPSPCLCPGHLVTTTASPYPKAHACPLWSTPCSCHQRGIWKLTSHQVPSLLKTQLKHRHSSATQSAGPDQEASALLGVCGTSRVSAPGPDLLNLNLHLTHHPQEQLSAGALSSEVQVFPCPALFSNVIFCFSFPLSAAVTVSFSSPAMTLHLSVAIT